MTKPPAPYQPEPANGAEIIQSDREQRIARRARIRKLQQWALAFIVAALISILVLMFAALLAWWLS